MSKLSLLRRKKHQDLPVGEPNVPDVADLLLTEHGLVDQHGNTIMRDITAEDLESILGNGINVAELQHLDLSINIEQQSVIDLPRICPMLISLNMDYSTINTIRNFGIYFTKLSVLTLNNCHLNDIDGISALPGLVELSLIDNYISDISPLAMHDNLSMLNLIGNNMHDLSFTDTLSSCYKVKSLFITKNPISNAQNYRLIIASLINTLQLLDGVPVDPESRQKISNSMILEAVSNIHSNEIVFNNNNNNNVVSEKRKVEICSTLLETGSDLTHGSTVVLAGNVAAAMRRRKSDNSKDLDLNGTGDLVPFFSEGDITDLHKDGKNKLNEINAEKVKQIKQRPMSAITTSRSEVPVSSNNTRPQSAVGRSRISNHCNSAPFKVASGSCSNNLEKPLTFLPNVSVSSAEKGIKGSSIIHKDIVIRHHNDESDSNSGSNSDDEYIGVSHASRHRLMTSQSRRQGKITKGSSSSTPPTSSKKNIITTPSSIGDDSSVNFSNNDISILSTPDHPILRISNQLLSTDVDSTIPTNDQYGLSLGFNLQGSLAAINQWVDEMDSDEENKLDSPDKNTISRIIAKYKKSEEADININVIPTNEASSGQRVLSREKIISMCNMTTAAAVNSDNISPAVVTVATSAKVQKVQPIKPPSKLPNNRSSSNDNSAFAIKVHTTSLNSDGSSPPRA